VAGFVQGGRQWATHDHAPGGHCPQFTPSHGTGVLDS